MKRFSALILLTCFLAAQFIAAPTPTKRAIIIAIGDYEEATGWKDISSINDIPLIEGALSKQGFTDFIIRKNEEATKAGILEAFDAMKARSNPGDIIVVHFSSHGQQIYDNNGDEIDGYDEAIVAYGAPASYEAGYTGENHLRDEELGNKLDELRQQLGKDGDVLVIVDACHSGTATRGNAVARGGKKPLAPAGYSPNKTDKKEVGLFEKANAASRGNTNLAPMVVISAARADELNYEYKGSGSLSLAVSRSFENLNSTYSYRTLFSKIAKEMSVLASKQNPAIEGDVDRLLFGGKVVNQEPYYTLKNLDVDALTIDGGVYTGLNEGARVKLFEAGTISTKDKEPVAIGTVTFSEAFTCNAVLDKPLEGEAKDYWVFVDEMAFGNLSVNINTTTIDNRALRNSLNNYITGFALAKVDENGDFEVEVEGNQLKLRNSSNGDYLTYFDSRNNPIDLIPTNDGFRTFRKVVTNYAQGKFWKELEIDNYDYNIELSLIPIRERANGQVDTLTLAEISDEGGIPQFSTDQKAVLRIQNNSSFAVYFNVLDIQPDGQVNLYLPQRNFPASELKIGPGERYEFRRNVVFYPPYGREIFKVLASFQPIDLQPVFMTRGSGSTRGNLSNELEKLFADSYGTRGAGVGNFSGTDAATSSFVFEIVKPIN